MYTCEEIQRGKHACKAPKLGPVERWWTQDGKLGISIQDSTLESGRRALLLYLTYSYCILSRVWKIATSLLVLRYYENLCLFFMLILHVTSSRFCSYLPNIHHFTYTFSHAHTEAYTHKHTCTISTQEEWRQPGTTAAWLRGAEERLCWRPCTKNKSNKTDIHESKEKIRAHKASRKASRLFLTKQ